MHCFHVCFQGLLRTSPKIYLPKRAVETTMKPDSVNAGLPVVQCKDIDVL